MAVQAVRHHEPAIRRESDRLRAVGNRESLDLAEANIWTGDWESKTGQEAEQTKRNQGPLHEPPIRRPGTESCSRRRLAFGSDSPTILLGRGFYWFFVKSGYGTRIRESVNSPTTSMKLIAIM